MSPAFAVVRFPAGMLLDNSERQAAEWFLAMFSPPLARLGELCFARGELGSVWLVRNGQRDSLPLEESISQNGSLKTELLLNDGQWESNCSCRRDRCPHAYAAMHAALKESIHSLASANANDLANVPKKPSDGEGLMEILSQKLGRSLKTREKEFISLFNKFHAKLRKKMPISFSDLDGLVDMYWHVPNLDLLRSKTDLHPLEFWQEFAQHCALHHVRIAPVLDPITDKTAIRQAISDRKRKQEIDDWKNKLVELPRSLASEGLPPVDFAVVISPAQVHVMLRTPSGSLKKLGSSALLQIIERVADGDQTVLPDALPIFTGFFGANSDYGASFFAVEEPSVRCLLSHLFRNPNLNDRLLTEHLEPFPRSDAPFRWHLRDTGDGDYNLQLVDAEGKAAPKDMVILPGHPVLYLAYNTVFKGPPIPRQISARPQRIPAQALESSEGLGLLSALQLPVPERIQARTRQVQLETLIKCRLRTVPMHNGEQCFVDFVAGSAETGSREHYTGDGWRPLPQRAPEGEQLYIFDRAQLEHVAALPLALNAVWDPTENLWRVRVTRNFPEKFLGWYEQVPKDYTFELDSELTSIVREPVKARVKLECEEAGVDWFDLRTTVNVDDSTLTPEEIRLLLNAKGKAVRLAGKGWRRLEYQISEQEDQSLARLGLSAYDLSAEPQRLHALQLADRASEKMLAAEQYQRICARAGEIKTRVTPAIPATISAALRPYQTDGFHFLSYLAENNFGGILADDMGLGKTVQTLTWVEWLRARRLERQPSLVVCPKSVMDNWLTEAAKFAPQLKVALWRGPDDSAFAKTASEHDLLVLNYAQLRSIAQTVAKVNWHVLILDEAQYIKNPDSQTAQAARALRADHRLALSGTPIENRLLDLWSIMAFAMPGILGNRADFRRRFEQQNDPFARRRLSARVRPFLLRRTKNQVASELPDRIEEDLVCEMEGMQQNLYRAEFKRAQQLLLRVQTQAELNEFRFNFLTSLLRLRQICCHPALVDEQHKSEESAKLNALLDLLDPLMDEGHKVLVFSQFVEMLHLIRERIEARNWKYFYLDGSSENRGELVQGFQEQEGAAVFLISLKAGGFGLNLTAASYVVLYDPWWNPAVENQAIDRTHRIGQTQKVIAYRLLTKNSIEQKIRALQRQKSTLADNVLGDESFSSSLTLNDLRFLFEDDPMPQ